MNLNDAQTPDRLVFRGIRGSHLYGTNVATSDVDIHGIYRLRPEEFVTLFSPGAQASDETHDTVFFELKRYMELAMTANPTVIEMMWTPTEFMQVTSDVFARLRAERQQFVTSKCFWSFTGYAFAQIKKAKGKNKKVRRSDDFNDEDGVALLREWVKKDWVTPKWIESRFCKGVMTYIMRSLTYTPSENTDWTSMDSLLETHKGMFKVRGDSIILRGPVRSHYTRLINVPGWDTLGFQTKHPMRPHPITETAIDLDAYHVASLEHVPNTYRLYYYGMNARGVFRDGQIVCESIPEEDEATRFVGLLVFNEQDYKKEREEYKSYWEWMANRNDARWVDQEEGTLDYDQKNMMHTVRLLLSGEHILRNGEPLIRFTGDMLTFLMGIRQGEYKYDYLLSYAEDKIAEMRGFYETTTLPHGVNEKRVAELYSELAFMELGGVGCPM